MAKQLTHQDRIERFLDKVMPEPNSGCWLWTGSLMADGYGECWAFGRRERAPRAAYREFAEPIPDGLQIRHKCDNKLCVNPDHLIPGTHADNMADKVERNRQPRGVDHGMVKLTEEQVHYIRRSPMSQRAVARELGVTQPLVGKIRRRELWSHI